MPAISIALGADSLGQARGRLSFAKTVSGSLDGCS
jgi:hypothetical protein